MCALATYYRGISVGGTVNNKTRKFKRNKTGDSFGEAVLFLVFSQRLKFLIINNNS
jgi:hypothetical protein